MLWTRLSFFNFDQNKSKGRAIQKGPFKGLVGISLKQFCSILAAIIFSAMRFLKLKTIGQGREVLVKKKSGEIAGEYRYLSENFRLENGISARLSQATNVAVNLLEILHFFWRFLENHRRKTGKI